MENHLKSIFQEVNGEYYSFFDQLRQRKLDSRQISTDYGNQAAFRLNYICPIIIKRGGLPLDQFADELGMTTDQLYQIIENYRPKYKALRELESYLEEGA